MTDDVGTTSRAAVVAALLAVTPTIAASVASALAAVVALLVRSRDGRRVSPQAAHTV